MSKIKNAFEKGKALILFLTCGDPDLETTGAAVRAAVENGADLIELGIPFSDPTAEGPVLQAASLRALEGGVTTDRIFDFVKELRRDICVPVLFRTYANVVFSYGADRFLAACGQIGIDGLIVTDLPFEEKDEFQPFCTKYGVDLISTVAPSSGKRAAMIAKEAEGLIELISGSGTEDGSESENALEVIRLIRENTDVPCVVEWNALPASGQAGEIAKICDGVIIGCEAVKLLEQYGAKAPAYIGECVKSLKL